MHIKKIFLLKFLRSYTVGIGYVKDSRLKIFKDGMRFLWPLITKIAFDVKGDDDNIPEQRWYDP